MEIFCILVFLHYICILQLAYMTHLELVNSNEYQIKNDLMIKFTGRYYTHESLIEIIIDRLLNQLNDSFLEKNEIDIIDPFSGDGRLIYHFIKKWNEREYPKINWNVELWDINGDGHLVAKEKFNELKENGIMITCNYRVVDTFTHISKYVGKFDLVITNPPWETLKPDTRELNSFTLDEKEIYIKSLRKYDLMLSAKFPDSQPVKKFAGWGTNLSRVGLDASYALVREKGCCLIILPASFFADRQSQNIRSRIFKSDIKEILYIPAEAKLFGKADVDSSILLFSKEVSKNRSFLLCKLSKELKTIQYNNLQYSQVKVGYNDYIIPININPKGLDILKKMEIVSDRSSLQEIKDLWIGRELDETRIDLYLKNKAEGIKFVRGRMIERYNIKQSHFQIYEKDNFIIPLSVAYEKIVWRDISRTSQARRMIATIIPPKFIAGNSLGVCCYKGKDMKILRILLGIMNSFCFEFQLRNYLATGHVSISALKKCFVPPSNEISKQQCIYELVEAVLNGDTAAEIKLEVTVAKAIYKLTKKEFEEVINSFDKITELEKVNILSQF